MTVSVSIFGATGYAGAELVRLLARHPQVTIRSLHARGRDGGALAAEFPHLAPLDLALTDGEPEPGVDVAFIALPSGHSAELAVRLAGGGTTVIDIGADLRLRDPSAYPTWYGFEHPEPDALQRAVYGLPELARSQLAGARLIANPGCYPTAALLALLPLARAGLLVDEVIIDAKSGISGAGRGVGQAYLFTELDASTSAYAVSGHRHTPEIAQGLADAGCEVPVTFVPHLVPQARGLLTTCYARVSDDLGQDELAAMYGAAFEGEPFVHVLDRPPATKLPAGSNHAFVHVSRTAPGRVVAIAAIDNLGKGAAGQAIQNMNLALGLPETCGLEAVGIYP
ncbi:MAG TPA: N-acetyl-gamma-glutamyl-phosphate reductase [Candidatus Binatia bacterium]|nr:N-acetyl-gamma-glutamyl-phosphate reductase [Candidatus Binatia bacterium]